MSINKRYARKHITGTTIYVYNVKGDTFLGAYNSQKECAHDCEVSPSVVSEGLSRVSRTRHYRFTYKEPNVSQIAKGLAITSSTPYRLPKSLKTALKITANVIGIPKVEVKAYQPKPNYDPFVSQPRVSVWRRVVNSVKKFLGHDKTYHNAAR